jgi:hypothetical protein
VQNSIRPPSTLWAAGETAMSQLGSKCDLAGGLRPVSCYLKVGHSTAPRRWQLRAVKTVREAIPAADPLGRTEDKR